MHSVRVDRINKMIGQRVSGTPAVAEIEAAGVQAGHVVRALADRADAMRWLFA